MFSKAKEFSTRNNTQKKHVDSKMETPLSENFYSKKNLLKKQK